MIVLKIINSNGTPIISFLSLAKLLSLVHNLRKAVLTIIIGSLVTDHSIFWKKISNTRKLSKKIQALGENQTYDPLTFSSDAYQ